MFKLRNTVAPTQMAFERALSRLPEAHLQAVDAATDHLHETATEAALQAGMDPEAVVVDGHPQAPFVGIAPGPVGDAVADREFGQPRHAPDAVLRTAVRSQLPTAAHVYHTHLREGLGL